MAHEITASDGMAYVGDKPWHDEGRKLEAGASMDDWAQQAGMVHRILRGKVQYNVTRPDENGNAERRTMDDSHVLFRSDDYSPLGIVSDRYHVVQPRQVLEFFAGTVEALGYTLETAGTLFGGKKYWAMAKTPNELKVLDARDRVAEYLLLSSSADGSSPTDGRRTTVRVVCNNTLQAALGNAEGAVHRISHRTQFDPEVMKAELGVEGSESRFAAAVAEFREMAETPINEQEVLTATATLFKPNWAKLERKEQESLFSRPKSPIAMVAKATLDHKAMGAGLDGASDTVWGWLNALSEHVDHHSRAASWDNRTNNALYGLGDGVKQKAYEMATRMVQAHREARPVYAVGTMDGGEIFKSLLNGARSEKVSVDRYVEVL